MALPPKFLLELGSDLQPFLAGTGAVSLRAAERAVGRCGRVAHVVPDARPFAGAMFAALTAAKAAPAEAPPGRVAARRFSQAASWMFQLVEQLPDAPLELRREVPAHGTRPPPSSTWTVEFDASPWGGGAVLKQNGVAHEYFAYTWDPNEILVWEVRVGDPAFQSFWEFLTLLMTLVQWGHWFVQEAVTILGDNTAALQDALDLKGRGAMLAVARELAWRKARHRWAFVVAHLPSEDNTTADALSRIASPESAAMPLSVAHALRLRPASVKKLWKLGQ